MKDYLIGIDVASSKVCAALGKVGDNGSFQVVGITSERCTALSKAVVIDIYAAAEAIKNCINKLEAVTHMSTKNIILSFPGGLCDLSNTKGLISITSENKEITEKDVERVMDAAKMISIPKGKEIIGVIPRYYTIDSHVDVSNPIGMISNRLEVDADVVLAESKPIFDLLLSMERAGIIPEEVIVQPVAQATLLEKSELTNCVALIDVGADTIDLGIYKDGNICYTNLIALGGSNITNDISKCLGISLAHAEIIKINYGDVEVQPEYSNEEIEVESSYEDIKSIKRDILTEIIAARVEEILQFILDELKASGYYDDIKVVVITGGGIAMFNHIDKLSKEVLNKSIRIAVPEINKDLNTTNTAAISIIRSKIDSYKPNNNITINQVAKNRENSKKIKGNKFGLKIRELLEELF